MIVRDTCDIFLNNEKLKLRNYRANIERTRAPNVIGILQINGDRSFIMSNSFDDDFSTVLRISLTLLASANNGQRKHTGYSVNKLCEHRVSLIRRDRHVYVFNCDQACN